MPDIGDVVTDDHLSAARTVEIADDPETLRAGHLVHSAMREETPHRTRRGYSLS